MSPVGLNRSSQTSASPMPTFWCVLVGIETYQDERLADLVYAGTDCQGIAIALSHTVPDGYQLRCFEHHRQSSQALTHAAIQSSFETILQSAQPQDRFLFYFSGHGVLDVQSEQAILCLEETDTTQLLETGLSIQWVMQQVNQCQARQKLLWLDACHSGGVSWSQVTDCNPTSHLIQTLSQSATQGFYALLACDRNQQSWEFPELGHGVFTYFLIQGLQGGAANEQGRIEVDALYRYVYHQTLGYIDQVNQNQRLINQQARRQGKPHLSAQIAIQTPKRIVEGTGEFILGQYRAVPDPSRGRKAIVIDGVKGTAPSLNLSKTLKNRGQFEVVHFPPKGRDWSELLSMLAQELTSTSGLCLLYIQGQVEPSQPDRICLREGISVSRSQLTKLLQQSSCAQRVVILDCPQAEHLDLWTEDLFLLPGHSQWMIAGASHQDVDDFVIGLERTLADAPASIGVSVAQWISQLQTTLASPAITLSVWLSGQPTVMELLPAVGQQVEPLDLGLCPYLGLRAFQESDAPFFYGRDRLIAELIDLIAHQSFLAVLGASGSGKSSLLHAGVIAQLREGRSLPQSEDWQIHSFRPGPQPLQALMRWMEAISGPSTPDVMASSNSPEEELDAFVLWLRSRPEPQVLCVVDQFEEFFTQADSDQRERVLSLLLGAVQLAGDRFKLVIALRSDFLSMAMDVSALAERISQSHCIVPTTLRRETYRQVILQPAEQVGLKLENGLVELLLQELDQVAHPLPLLEFVLEKLWQYRQSGQLTLEAYRTYIGGLQGALQNTAQAVYESLSVAEKDCAQWIFLSLTQLNEDAEDTRRQISRQALEVAKYSTAIVQSTLEKLLAAKLIVFHDGVDGQAKAQIKGKRDQDFAEDGEDDGDRSPSLGGMTRIELIHEVLIRQWDLLKRWLQDNRTRLQAQRQVAQSAQDWDRSDRQSDFLLRGVRLDAAMELYRDRKLELSQLTQTFILAGIQQQQREEQAAKRRLRQAYGAIALLTALGSIALGLGWMALRQQQHSVVNEIRSLNALSDAQRLSNQPLAAIETAKQASQKAERLSSFLLGDRIHSIQLQSTVTLQQTLLTTQARMRWRGHDQRITAIATSPKQDWVASGSWDGTVKIWLPDGSASQNIDVKDRITDILAHPTTDSLLIATAGGTVIHWNVRTGQRQATYQHSSWITQLAVSPDGETLAIGGRSPDITLLKFTPLQRIQTLNGNGGWINSVAFSPDGAQLAAASEDKQISFHLISSHTGEARTTEASQVPLPINLVAIPTAIAFDPTQPHLYVGDETGEIHRWDRLTQQVQTYSAHQDGIKALQFNPVRQQLVSASLDHSLKVWDTRTMKTEYGLQGHQEPVTDLHWLTDNRLYSGSADRHLMGWTIPKRVQSKEGLMVMAGDPESSVLVSGYWDGTVRVSVNEKAAIQVLTSFTAHDEPITAIALSARYIATAGTDPVIKIWSLDGELIHTLQGHQGGIQSLDFHPKGELLASGGDDGAVRIWDVQKGRSLRELRHLGENGQESTQSITQVVFHPQGHQIVSGNQVGEIAVWNTRGPLEKRLEIYPVGVTQLSFSPDGRFLLSGGRNQQVQRWSAKSYELMDQFTAHEGDVDVLRVSLDSRFLATASGSELKLWRLDSMEELNRLALSQEPISQFVWLRDRLVVGYENQSSSFVDHNRAILGTH